MNLVPAFIGTSVIALLASIAMVATCDMVYNALHMLLVFLATVVLYLMD